MEYKVVELRQALIGDKISGKKLEKLLNKEAQDGWLFKSMTSTDVKGRIGPGSVEGVVIIFERKLA